ncbi:MAG: hypothetical protein CK604_06230 [Curvibacter sp. PD_MW3]|nr:MAG: hypothetical protein CK604_06230 [Curvibacter sp. PD_MW3]
MAKIKLPKQFHADLAALAAYEPRKRAIQWILEGDFDPYLDWIEGDGYFAAHGKPRELRLDAVGRLRALFEPMPLDAALAVDRLGDAGLDELAQADRIAREALPRFGQSAFEIAMRADDGKAFSKLLDLWKAPSARYLRGSDPWTKEADWKGFNAHIALKRAGLSRPAFLDRRGWDMLILPFLVGKPERADHMVRAGMAPKEPFEWASFSEKAQELAKIDAKLLSELVGSEAADPARASEWGRERGLLAQKLEEAAGEAGSTNEDFARTALAMIEQGAPIGYFALAVASERADLGLLKKLFEAGGDPNCRYKTGVPMLARLNGAELTADTVSVWMKAGCRPTMDPGSEEPFGHGMNPSALYEFTWSGRLDLLKACAEHAQGPLSFTEELRDGSIASDLLALAIDKGHEEVAAWLVEEKGCRLDHLYTGDGEPVRGFAEGKMLARLVAIEERLALKADPYTTATDKGSKPKRL